MSTLQKVKCSFYLKIRSCTYNYVGFESTSRQVDKKTCRGCEYFLHFVNLCTAVFIKISATILKEIRVLVIVPFSSLFRPRMKTCDIIGECLKISIEM